MIKPGAQPHWTKSTHSGGNGACIEIRSNHPASLEITDSKHDHRSAPVVTVSPAAFAALVGMARA